MFLKIRTIIVLLLALALGPYMALAQSHPVAPSISFSGLSGEKIALSDFKGSVVALNFWTTSCGVCLSEISTLSALQDRYGSEGLRVLGVAVGDRVELIRRVAEQRHIRYTLASGDNELEERFGVDGFPVTILIGRDGRVYSQHSGAINGEAVESEITQLLAGGTTAPVERFRAAAGAEPVRLPTAAELNSEIPGVDLSRLNRAQIMEVKQQLDSELCPCGCGRTVLQCRAHHSSCNQSKEMARQVVEKLHSPMI